MENMHTYFEKEHKNPRWDSSSSILHREPTEHRKDNNIYDIKNSYGRLHYLKKDRHAEQNQEGLTLEALEAPNTRIHTEKEKHLDHDTMKKITHGDKQMLYASEVPLRSQALFYDMSCGEKSADFLACMKEIVKRQGHQTLTDAFGFLDQEPERRKLEMQREDPHYSRPEEFDQENKHTDILNNRLRKKEAKERQLCSELKIMLDQRNKKQPAISQRKSRQNEENTYQPDRQRKSHENVSKKHWENNAISSFPNASTEDITVPADEPPEEYRS